MFVKKIILGAMVLLTPFHYVHAVHNDSSVDLALGITTAILGVVGIGFLVKWHNDAQVVKIQKDAECLVAELEDACLQCSRAYEHEYMLLSDPAATMVALVQTLPCSQSSYSSYKNSVDDLQRLYDKAQSVCSVVTESITKNRLQERLFLVNTALVNHQKSVALWQKTCQEHASYQKLYDLVYTMGMAAEYAYDNALYKEYSSGACSYEWYAEQVYKFVCARASQQGTPFLCAVALDMLTADYEHLLTCYNELQASSFYRVLASYSELAVHAYELLRVLETERAIIAVHPQYRNDAQARLFAQQQQQIADAAVKESFARQELVKEQKKMNALKEEELYIRSRELYELQRANDRRDDVIALQRKLDKVQQKLERVKDNFKRDNRAVLKELKALDSELEYAKQHYGEAISASWLQSKLSSIRRLISDESDSVYNILIEIFVG